MSDEKKVRDFGQRLVDWCNANAPTISPSEASVFFEAKVAQIVSLARRMENHKATNLQPTKCG